MRRYFFTSGYIYDGYEVLRDKLKDWVTLAAPLKDLVGRDLPIIQGCGCSEAPCCEWVDLHQAINGIETSTPVRFTIIPEDLENSPVYVLDKYPNGETERHEVYESYLKLEDMDKYELEKLNYKINE